MRKPTAIISAIVLYLIVTGISYASFSYISSPPSTSNSSTNTTSTTTKSTDGQPLLNIQPSEPKTEACPLNGELYTVTEKNAWEKRRPLVVMVENSPDARPHSGINRADVVYEAVAEGGVTRFMPIFYCDAQHADVAVAPVRSVRTYFLDWASEYGGTPLFGHVGGANCSGEKLPNGNMGPCKTDPRAQAIEQLSKYGWRGLNDLDQMGVGLPMYERKENRLFAITGQNVATEHSVVGDTEALWKYAQTKRGFTNLDPDGKDWTDSFKPWTFKADAAPTSRGTVISVSYDFWSGYKQFDARWDYDATTNSYKRFTGGEPHKILETGEQITAKNIVVQLTKETRSIDSLGHSLYTTIGNGDAYIFQDGNAIKGFWKKDSRTGRTVFTTKKGAEIAFNPGRIWVSVINKDNIVAYPTPTP
jgi:hypothetical protein